MDVPSETKKTKQKEKIMSDYIIDGVDTVYAPEGQWEKMWHNKQTVVPGGIANDGNNTPNVFCSVEEIGLGAIFQALKSVPDSIGLLGSLNISGELLDSLKDGGLNDWKLIVADCRQGLSKSVIPLHIPKKGYRRHQNKELFDCQVAAAKQVLGDNGFEIVTVGTLGGYTQFFTSLLIKGQETFDVGTLANGLADKWNKFFNLNSSHNGLIGSNRSMSTIRQVCWNTVNASIQDAENQGTIASIKHTENSATLITADLFARDLKAWMAQGERFQTMLATLKSEAMTVDTFKAFASGVFTNEKSDELSTNSFNRVNDMIELFQRGQGNIGVTRYDALNAFTEYFTSGKGVGNPNNVSANRRIATANYGKGNDWKLEAMRVLSNEDAFAPTVKRGEILFTDKLRVETAKN